MQLLKRWVLRIWDAGHAACAVLFGRLELRNMRPTSQVKQSAEHARALLEVTSVLEMMHAMISRMGARESRAAKKLLDAELRTDDATAQSNGPGQNASPIDRKRALRAYMTAKRFGTGALPPPPVVAPVAPAVDNSNGDEQLELDEGEP